VEEVFIFKRCCSVLQRPCCSVLQCVAVSQICNVVNACAKAGMVEEVFLPRRCCSVLRHLYCSVLPVLHCVALCYSALQCVAASLLQCVPVGFILNIINAYAKADLVERGFTTRWRRCRVCLKSQVSFCQRATHYRGFLRSLTYQDLYMMHVGHPVSRGCTIMMLCCSVSVAVCHYNDFVLQCLCCSVSH